jgi:hypothetical protein
VKKNVLPSFGVDLNVIFPPRFSANAFAIVSPIPIPPYFRVIESSPCLNKLNIILAISSGIPTPVSSTKNLISFGVSDK